MTDRGSALRTAFAWVCLVCVLAFSGLDAIHQHSTASAASNGNLSQPCQICQLAATAQPVAHGPGPVQFHRLAERLTLPAAPPVMAAPERRTCFIRPPPASLSPLAA